MPVIQSNPLIEGICDLQHMLVMKEMPGGHAGAKTTWRKLHKNYPGIEVSLQTVSDYAQACPVCQKAGNTTQPAVTRAKTLSINNAQSTTCVDFAR